MNDNPGETPNPLNPDPAVGSGINESAQAAAATAASNAEPTTTVKPVESLDPTGRSMAKTVETPEAPKKSKAGIITAIIIGCALLIGGIVAAVLVMMNANRGDAVAAAMQKIMSGEAPTKVAIDGDINILLNDEDLPFKRLNVNLDSDIMVGSMINTSSAVLSFTDQYDKDYSMKFEEIYAANGDLYFKVEDVKSALEDSGLLDLVSGSTGGTSETNEAILSVIEAIDGVYLRVSSEEMNLLKNESLGNSNMSCVTDLVSKLNKNSNSTIQLYNKYPFIASSNKDITVASKQNPVYQIWLDDENFAGFVNEMQSTEIASSLHSCLGWDNNATITEEDVAKVTSKMPKIYAEVDGNNNFTRLYMDTDINEGAANATIDLGFSYPANINVSEPVEYTDFSKYIQTVFKSMYNL